MVASFSTFDEDALKAFKFLSVLLLFFDFWSISSFSLSVNGLVVFKSVASTFVSILLSFSESLVDKSLSAVSGCSLLLSNGSSVVGSSKVSSSFDFGSSVVSLLSSLESSFVEFSSDFVLSFVEFLSSVLDRSVFESLSFVDSSDESSSVDFGSSVVSLLFSLESSFVEFSFDFCSSDVGSSVVFSSVDFESSFVCGSSVDGSSASSTLMVKVVSF